MAREFQVSRFLTKTLSCANRVRILDLLGSQKEEDPQHIPLLEASTLAKCFRLHPNPYTPMPIVYAKPYTLLRKHLFPKETLAPKSYNPKPPFRSKWPVSFLRSPPRRTRISRWQSMTVRRTGSGKPLNG